MPARRLARGALAVTCLAVALGAAADGHASDLYELGGPDAGNAGPESLLLGGPYLALDHAVAFTAALDWHFRRQTQDIRRGYLCLANEAIAGHPLCDKSSVGYANDLHADTLQSTLDVRLGLTLFRLVELRVRVPIVLTETTHVRFDDGVDGKNSLTAPYNADQVFAVPNTSPTRAGLADPTIGLWAAFLSTQRDPDDPSVVVGLDVTLPVTAARQPGTAAVGNGAWAVDLAIGASGRLVPWLAPFGRLDVVIRVPAADALYPDRGSTQAVSGPPHEVSLTFGTEFIPFEVPSDQGAPGAPGVDAPGGPGAGSAVRITLGGRVALLTQGKFPTALFDAIGTSPCDPSDLENPCGLTTTAAGGRASGATIVEEHLALQTWVGVDYDVFRVLRLSARASVGWESPHDLTLADRGLDLDGQGGLQPFNALGVNEFDPDYNPAWDAPGNRFRSADAVTVGVDFSVSGHF